MAVDDFTHPGDGDDPVSNVPTRSSTPVGQMRARWPDGRVIPYHNNTNSSVSITNEWKSDIHFFKGQIKSMACNPSRYTGFVLLVEKCQNFV